MYNFCFFILLAVYFSELLFPPLTAFTPSSTICLLCFFGWILLSVLYDKKYYQRMNIGRFFSLLFYFFSFLMPYFFGYKMIAHRYMTLPLVPFGFLVYSFHKDHNQDGLISRIIKLCIILSTITALITTIALFENAYVSRSIKSGGDLSRALAYRGIGGYSLIYFGAICSVLLLHCLLNAKNTMTKFVGLTVFLIDVLLIIKSNYMTAVLVCLVEIVVYIALTVYNKNRKSFVGFFGCVSIIVIISLLFVNYGNELAQYLPSRIADTITLSQKGIIKAIIDEFFIDRWPVMEESIISFIEHPLFGLIGSGGIGNANGFLTGFGQHSYILDTFALYGLFVGIYIPKMLLEPFKTTNKKLKPLEISCLVGMLLIYFFNNATESIALAIGFIFPYVRDRFGIEKDEKKG